MHQQNMNGNKPDLDGIKMLMARAIHELNNEAEELANKSNFSSQDVSKIKALGEIIHAAHHACKYATMSPDSEELIQYLQELDQQGTMKGAQHPRLLSSATGSQSGGMQAAGSGGMNYRESGFDMRRGVPGTGRRRYS